jgi:fibronectin type 3 domain-containing protein
MKKLSLLLLAIATVLTLSQCKKKVEQIEPTGDKLVPITLDVKAVSDGQKINVDPNTGEVSFELNDVVYVGSGGKYVGKLECHGTKFMGTLTNPVPDQSLYFYFLGNRFIYEEDAFVPGTSDICSFDIIDQSDPDNMPVISMAISEEPFTGSGTYHAFFYNKGALVKFNVTTESNDPIYIERPGLVNFMELDFGTNDFIYYTSNECINLGRGSGERWVILMPQNAIPAGGQGSAYSHSLAYTGTCGAIPQIVSNGYYFDGIPVVVNTPTGQQGDAPATPAYINSSVNGSKIYVSWQSSWNAAYYKIYRSSSYNGTYEKVGESDGTFWYDLHPEENNYYKVSAANDFGESSMTSQYAYVHYTASLPPSTPSNVTATVSGSTVVLAWDEVEGADSYYIYRSATADGTFYIIGGSFTPTFTDQGPGSDNYYRLAAVNSVGQSAQSDIVYCAFSGSAPATPTGVSSYNTYTHATISWNSSEGASSYKIYKSSTKNGSYGCIGTTTQTSFVDDNLQTDNFYKVSAANSWGESEKSGWTYCYLTTAAPTGAINGKFSISANDQVYFSQGNLMYRATTQVWRFQEEQWNICGQDNANISSSYNGWIDLFGWGTSGWDNGNTYYRPYDSEFDSWSDGAGYGPTDGSNYDYNLTGTYANADWGVYNAIQNGGNQAGLWRTLTYEEWYYVLNGRGTTSGIRYAKAYLPFDGGREGILLFPDDWPELVDVNNTNNPMAAFSSNIFSSETWALMQYRGVVFLPVAGYRFLGDPFGPSIANTYFDGTARYWTASTLSSYWTYTSKGACSFRVDNDEWQFDFNEPRYCGYSIRLVHDAN